MIHINELSKRYGKHEALKNITLTIQSGTCFGLIGPNGAGKSTLMKILCGILDGYTGEITLDGKLGNDMKTEIGYIPQEIVLHEELSAIDNLRFFGSVYGLRRAELTKRVQEVLELVGLEDRGKDAVATFSGGMKRRINIGCGLMHNPTFIIMDEPTVGIDPQSRNYIFSIILTLKKQGKTILYSSHYMEEIQYLCDDVALIDHGSVAETGPVANIIATHSARGIYVEAEGITENSLVSFGDVLASGNGYLVRTENQLDTLEQITMFIRANGIETTRLELSQTSLEDIFLALTGTKLRDKRGVEK